MNALALPHGPPLQWRRTPVDSEPRPAIEARQRMTSLLYSSPIVYQATMRLLYGRHFEARYAAIAERIPHGVRVVDVCAGDGYLYRRYLRRKSVDYLGLEASARMVEWVRSRGVPAMRFDLNREAVPEGDYVVMQASLYQFIPDERAALCRVIAAARRQAIVTEPIHNLSSSRYRLVAGLSRLLTTPTASQAYSGRRFDRLSLAQLFHSFDALEESFLVAGEKEMAGVFRGSAR